MATRIGARTIALTAPPAVVGSAAVGAGKEAQGPLGGIFAHVFRDALAGEKTWEQAESRMQNTAIRCALEDAALRPAQVQLILAGDLLNQCSAATFALRDMHIPFAGVYSACSTMALALALAAILTDSGAVQTAAVSTSSHFCAAEKQFRMPLEYGGQRAPTAQWTATAAGAAVLSGTGSGPRVERVIFGRIRDYAVKDAANMGAAMAPAACDTIAAFLQDTKTEPQAYDMILTGDLGSVGSALLVQLLDKEHGIDVRRVHADCGLMLYDRKKQDVHAGGSGCGCSASVVCGNILPRLRSGALRRVLFVATGALLSGTSTLQGETIPGVAHGVLLTGEEAVR